MKQSAAAPHLVKICHGHGCDTMAWACLRHFAQIECIVSTWGVCVCTYSVCSVHLHEQCASSAYCMEGMRA